MVRVCFSQLFRFLVIKEMNTSSCRTSRIALPAVVLAIVAFIVAQVLPLSALMVAILVLVASLATSFWICRAGHQTGTCERAASIAPVAEGPGIQNAPLPADTVIKTLYVGNLPYRANETAIRKLFSAYGHVISVRLVKDKETGKRRGYGFIEMPEQEAQAAIAGLNETEYLQRTLKVREANEKKETGDAAADSL